MSSYEQITRMPFTAPRRVEKSVNTLQGLIKGIAIDGNMSPAECKELRAWCGDNQALLSHHPFSELVPKVEAALKDSILDSEEQADILWLCQNLTSGSQLYDVITTEVQILHGMLHGILADGNISNDELVALRNWMQEKDYLKGTYPFDELEGVLTSVLADGQIDDAEQKLMAQFFEDFVSYSMSKKIEQARRSATEGTPLRLPGVCSVCPEIKFRERVFCFTGTSARAARADIVKQIIERKGQFKNAVSPALNYLVVGAAGNPCWAFSCYGRKVEQAIQLRKEGYPLLIVHENDFWDAIQDAPVTVLN